MASARPSWLPSSDFLRTARGAGSSRLHRLFARFGDRTVQLAEEALGEDLDSRIARIQTAVNEAGVDPFGFDPRMGRYALAVAALIHRFYFRTECFHIDRVPPGRLLLVANHSGQVPIDGLLLTAALMLDAEPPRLARSMVDHWSAQLPFVSVFFPRTGQVVGAPENARRLLQRDEVLIVFPEGTHGIAKTIDQRYQLRDFGLGFMRLALETKTPIVPVAVIGGEEQYVSVGDVKPLARLLGWPAFPLLPQLLFGMALPLPTKYRLHFGSPIEFEGDPDDDDAVMREKVNTVRATLQSMVNQGLKQRRGIFT